MLEKSMYDFTYSDSYTKGDYAIEEDIIIRSTKGELCISVKMERRLL